MGQGINTIGDKAQIVTAVSPADAVIQAQGVGARFGSVTLAPVGASDWARVAAVL
jgi:hypothetical protein